MKRFALLCGLAIGFAVGMDAAPGRLDSLLTRRFSRLSAKVDTAYITPSPYTWTFRSLANLAGSSAELTGTYEDRLKYSAPFYTDFRTSLTLTANYRGLVVGFSVNPARLTGRNKDMEFYILGYGNRFGFDAVIQSASTYKGHIRLSDLNGTLLNDIEVPAGYLSQRGLTLNSYYCFNHRRFSYPAAFTHSHIQRRSAGSMMVCLNYQRQQLERNGDPYEDLAPELTSISTRLLALGGGYAHHFVPNSHWLLHISGLPSFVVYDRNRTGWANGETQEMRYSFPEIIITGQFASIYSWNRYFTGLSMYFNYSSIGRHTSFNLSQQTWRVRYLFGVRL